MKTPVRNYQTMLHILPGLVVLSDAMIKATLEGESIETLKRRLDAFLLNIREMTRQIISIEHIPNHVQPLVQAMRDTCAYAEEVHSHQESCCYPSFTYMLEMIGVQVELVMRCKNDIVDMEEQAMPLMVAAG